MSGLEVAGLILGRLPLVISALEYYQSSLSILKYRSEKSEIREVEHSLKYRQTLFHTTVELLLHQFLEPAEIQELLSDPTGSKWQNKSVDLALRESIGHDEYILFSDTTKQLFEALSSLQESLRKITDGSKANRLLSRSNLRWALSKDTTRDAVNKIEGQTEILRTLVLYSSLPKPHEIRQVIQNIKTAIKGVPEFEDLTRNLQHFTSCTICIPPDADVDVRSLYSVESEVSCSGFPTLEFTDTPMSRSTARSQASVICHYRYRRSMTRRGTRRRKRCSIPAPQPVRSRLP
ncbi:hypothetical protein F4781DRAFT_4317 [Annulohypoxylon bovei var. microspora]|nr:hypothetical protein F4781DRAFT_4317 [Annulohypoxylon bovei var. microspora]